VALAAISACSRQDQRLQQHREELESLSASAAAIGSAWLSGDTSGTYTLAALEQMYLLTEKERTALASTPAALADPRGAQLSQSAERLARVLAAMRHDVRTSNASSVRRHLSDIAGKASEQR
jgi:hypothetical protein